MGGSDRRPPAPATPVGFPWRPASKTWRLMSSRRASSGTPRADAGGPVQHRATGLRVPLSCHTAPHSGAYLAVFGHREFAFTQRVEFPRSRGRSSEAEHQLPKLRTRVRFPSPALTKRPGQGHGIAVSPRRVRGIHVPFRAIREVYDSPSGLDLVERSMGACHCRAIGHCGSCPNHVQEP